MSEIRDILSTSPVVPVVVVDSAADGVAVGRALVAGGITTAEVTFRTPAARDAIIAMKAEIPELTVGAGTVIDVGQAESAISAGAEYIVSPGFARAVVQACQEAAIPALPACTDGSWILCALDMGLDTVKFFPAGALGGIKALKALAAPFPQLRFVPTGGIDASNLEEYLKLPTVLSCGGSWLVDKQLVSGRAWEEITRLASEAVAIAKEAGR